jgi:hypothetical protein
MTTTTKTTTTTEARLTWQRLVRAEPRLRELLDEVRAVERDIWATREHGVVRMFPYRSVRVYLDLIKPTVECLVGWERRCGPASLRTSEAYDLVIKKLWDALPNDFDDDDLEEAWETAHEIDLDEGEWVALAGPEAA